MVSRAPRDRSMPMELGGWAAGLYQASSTESPLREAMVTIDQLEVYPKALAAKHVLASGHADDGLLDRLADSERVITWCRDLMSAAHAAGRRLTPAAEWLLDNHYLVEEQVDLARRHLPRGYSRQMPGRGRGPARPR